MGTQKDWGDGIMSSERKHILKIRFWGAMWPSFCRKFLMAIRRIRKRQTHVHHTGRYNVPSGWCSTDWLIWVCLNMGFALRYFIENMMINRQISGKPCVQRAAATIPLSITRNHEFHPPGGLSTIKLATISHANISYINTYMICKISVWWLLIIHHIYIYIFINILYTWNVILLYTVLRNIHG